MNRDTISSLLRVIIAAVGVVVGIFKIFTGEPVIGYTLLLVSDIYYQIDSMDTIGEVDND